MVPALAGALEPVPELELKKDKALEPDYKLDFQKHFGLEASAPTWALVLKPGRVLVLAEARNLLVVVVL